MKRGPRLGIILKTDCCRESTKKLGKEATPCKNRPMKSGEKKSGSGCPFCPK
jgi:hypothetical protein